NYLVGFGAEDIPDRFAFCSLPTHQTSAGVGIVCCPMDEFLAWAAGYHSPGHGILKLIGQVEAFLTWAMAWCRRTGMSSLAEHKSPAAGARIDANSAQGCEAADSGQNLAPANRK